MFLAAWISYAIMFVLAGIETVQSSIGGVGGPIVPSTLAILVFIIGRGKSHAAILKF